MVGRGRGDGASLLSKQVFHQDAIACHVCHEPRVTVLSSSLFEVVSWLPTIFFLPFSSSVSLSSSF